LSKKGKTMISETTGKALARDAWETHGRDVIASPAIYHETVSGLAPSVRKALDQELMRLAWTSQKIIGPAVEEALDEETCQ
jgi:hypothetical protein